MSVAPPLTVKPPLRLARSVAVKVPPTTVLPLVESMLVPPTVSLPPVIPMPLVTVSCVKLPSVASTASPLNFTPLMITLS